MKKGRIIVLAIAFMAAIGAAMIARNMVSETETVTVEKTVGAKDVLVTAKDLKLGDTISEGSLKWQQWPEEGVTPELVTREKQPDAISDFMGSVARAPFVSGEPVNNAKLVKPGEGGVLAAILPAGMRAISTPISEESAAGGFILPNDRVDVILTRRMQVNNKDQQISETVLRNVRVLAIGQTLETTGEEKVASGATATLELTPRQTEILSLAQSMGQLSLSLRSLADTPKPGSTLDISEDKGSSVKVLKYGLPSQVFGVN
ncbi:SAF domain protein [Methyloligella halotolerans]|uniref:SAF domain protein n=1 Tax=Methyloligella halotolerans TaxID=1177755 RepID=A0A1E2RVX8_9HYPH|nr:Flp pilus assembly protein CpaB [Methyloligella halotolerans]ODA66387.1 SAF domain protein [Methyloligella halotolerans]